jgi:hypothetical protein
LRKELHRKQLKRSRQARLVRAQGSETAIQVSCSAAANIPRLVVAQSLFPALHRYVTRSVWQNGNRVEIGGMLVGEFHQIREDEVFKIHRLIEAGPRAECTPDSILFDHGYQAAMLERIQLQQPTLGNMGCIHSHPGKMDQCSSGDYQADVAAVKQSDTRALVFGIITLKNSRPDPFSIRHRNLKVDFFLLGEQTSFNYVHVKPEVVGMPAPPKNAAEGSYRGEPSCCFGEHHSWGGLLEDKRRLVAEVRAMEERYGDRAVLRHERNQLFWEYTVVESGRRFPIEVRYPRRYPLEPPRVISVLPLPSSPHQLVNNELCWINRAAGDWNPARDTAATCIHAAQRWFACLLVYLTLGKWPEEANDEPLRTL